MNIEQSMWVEKYRPQRLEEMVLPDEYRHSFKECIEKGDIGNLLFFGPAGGGKTALARILTGKNGVLKVRDNLLEVNGSSKECRSINFVDQVIEPFLKIPPAGKDKWRIVYIDECDNMTPDAFKSLRGVIEKYQVKFGRFIFTCNYVSKLPDPLRSRFQEYAFKRVPIDFVTNYVRNILESENVKYDPKDLKFLVSGLYPDVRKIVNQLQRSSYNGKMNINRDAIYSIKKLMISSIVEIVDAIQNNQSSKINKSLIKVIELATKSETDFRSIYENLFESNKIPIPVKIIINEYANKHADSFIPAQHFIAMVFKSIKVMQDYAEKSRRS